MKHIICIWCYTSSIVQAHRDVILYDMFEKKSENRKIESPIQKNRKILTKCLPMKTLYLYRVPNTFIKLKNKHISWSAVWNVVKFVFIVCSSRGLPKYILTKVLITWFYLIWSFFNNKRKPGTSFPDSLSGWFLKKEVSDVILY